MNYKRKKCKRTIRCTMCTPHRWRGNGPERFNQQAARNREKARVDGVK